MIKLISLDDAIKALLKEQQDDIEAYGGCAIPEGFDGDRAVRVLMQLSPISDISQYSDRLWKLAYERGKKEGFDAAHIVKVEYLTDGEKRIFLSAMRREEKKRFVRSLMIRFLVVMLSVM